MHADIAEPLAALGPKIEALREQSKPYVGAVSLIGPTDEQLESLRSRIDWERLEAAGEVGGPGPRV